MQCTKPITLFKIGKVTYPNGLQLPCGKCLACRIKKQSEWSLRLMHELSYHEKSVFLTLTYNDLNLPHNNSLDKRDLQLFFKRLRKNGAQIKYFACGEYGELEGRPHYHAIIYGLGLNKDDKDLIKRAWTKCDWTPERTRKSFGLVERHSIQYVAGYIQKKLSGELEVETYTSQGRQNVFKLASNGLGKQYCIDNAKQLSDNLYAIYNGNKVTIPRYYIKLLDIDTELLQQEALSAESELVANITGITCTRDDLYRAGSKEENAQVIDRLKASRNQRDRNLKQDVICETNNYDSH